VSPWHESARTRAALACSLLAALLLAAPAPISRATAAVASGAAPVAVSPGSQGVGPEEGGLTALAAAPAAQGLTPVRVGMQYIVSDAGLLIADEWGYFREMGIEFQGQRLDNIELQTAMASGQADAGGIGPTAALLNAYLRGVRLRLVGDRGTVAPGFGYIALVVRQDLVDSGQVHDVGDLRGRQIAAQPPLYATPGYYLLARLLESAGLTEAEVQYVPLGFADQVAGLAGGIVDAIWGAEPGPTTVVERGLGVRLRGADEVLPNFDIGVLAYAEPFAAETELGRRFMVAYLRGVRTYLDAFTRNLGRDRVIDLLTRHTALRDPAIYDRVRMPYMNPDGAFNTMAYHEVQEYFVRHGVLPRVVDISQMVDNSFAEYAAQQLGPYR
jgi:NitT/TauT family transport system substrate-binding protein